MLHLVFASSPAWQQHLKNCLATLAAGDVVLLLDGESNQPAKEAFIAEFERIAAAGSRALVLEEGENKSEPTESIGYDEFVQLVAEHEHSRSWF